MASEALDSGAFELEDDELEEEDEEDEEDDELELSLEDELSDSEEDVLLDSEDSSEERELLLEGERDSSELSGWEKAVNRKTSATVSATAADPPMISHRAVRGVSFNIEITSFTVFCRKEGWYQDGE